MTNLKTILTAGLAALLAAVCLAAPASAIGTGDDWLPAIPGGQQPGSPDQLQSLTINYATSAAAQLLHLGQGAGFDTTWDETDVVATANARAWNGQRADGSRVRVFLLDSGISPDAGARMEYVENTATSTATYAAGVYPLRYIAGADFITDAYGPGDGTASCPGGWTGHGDGMFRDIAMIAPGAVIIPVRIAACNAASAAWSTMRAGLTWVVANATAGDVVSISYGLLYRDADLLNQITAKGALVVVAGNNTTGSDLCTNPAGDGVTLMGNHTAEWQSITGLVVGGVATGTRSAAGAIGPCIEVVAPWGGALTSTAAGQSNSTAYTAGAAAAYWSGQPTLTAPAVTAAFLTGALGVSGGYDIPVSPSGSPDRLVRLAGPPSAPRLDAAVQTDSGEVTLTWTKPAIPGGTISGYTVLIDGQANPGCTGLSASSTTCALTGLTAGPHVLALTATNQWGTGTPAGLEDSTGGPRGTTVRRPATSTMVTASTVPTAPTVTGSATSMTSLTVSWPALADAGTPLTGHTVTLTPPAGGTPVVQQVSASTRTATFNGLTAGTAYTVQVTGQNAWGSGAASAPLTLTTTTPAPPPTPPTNGGGSGGGSGGSSSTSSNSGSRGTSSGSAAAGGAMHQITEVRPATGSTRGGDTIALVGFGFTTVREVRIGGVPAAFTLITDAHIDVVTPAGVSGPADVLVVLAPTVGSALAPGGFVYTTPSANPDASAANAPANPALAQVSPTASVTAPVLRVTATKTGVRVLRITAPAGTARAVVVRLAGGKTWRTITTKAAVRLPKNATKATVTVAGKQATIFVPNGVMR